MSDGTKIEWTDATWNPVTGCSVVSAGCKHCYAMKLAGTRLQHHPSRAGLTVDTKNGPVWTGEVRLNENWLDQPLRWRKPRMIFVCAHADLFHEAVPVEWIDKVFAIMGLAYVTGRRHDFQVLTKRAGRMHAYLNDPGTVYRVTQMMKQLGPELPGENSPPTWPLPNVWLGVSVEDQAAANERIPLLLDTPAAVRWISAEPLLGPVDLRVLEQPDGTRRDGLGYGLDWVVVGGESGTGARPMHPDWARSLRDQCACAGVPFLFKQWGEWAPDSKDFRSVGSDAATKAGYLPKDHRIPGGGLMLLVGKKLAGRLLDGVQHDGYPEVRP